MNATLDKECITHTNDEKIGRLYPSLNTLEIPKTTEWRFTKSTKPQFIKKYPIGINCSKEY